MAGVCSYCANLVYIVAWSQELKIGLHTNILIADAIGIVHLVIEPASASFVKILAPPSALLFLLLVVVTKLLNSIKPLNSSTPAFPLKS